MKHWLEKRIGKKKIVETSLTTLVTRLANNTTKEKGINIMFYYCIDECSICIAIQIIVVYILLL